MRTMIIGIFILVAAIVTAKKTPIAKAPYQKDIGQSIVDYARKHNIEPGIVHAVITVESNWKPNARGKAGELGLMQLMPGTAKDLGIKDRSDPQQNIEGGIRYLAYCKRKTGNAYLRCYNAGERGIHLPQAYAYEQKVLGAKART